MLKTMSKLLTLLFVIAFVALVSPKFGGQVVYGGSDLEEQVAAFSLRLVMMAGIFVALLILGSMAINKPREAVKQLLFWSMVGIVSGTTLSLIYSTVRLNQISWSKGPVHWHADYQVWACGQEFELKDPQGRFSNKVGTATLHENNDKRIHLEGVAVSQNSAMLGRFFEVVGGELTFDAFSLPTPTGPIRYMNGDYCTDGTPGLVQVFAYTVNADKTYSQHKVIDPASHVISPLSQVPDGDCIIIEFDVPKERTDRLCKSYEVAKQTGKLMGEVQ